MTSLEDVETAQAAVDRERVRRGGMIEFVRRAWHIVEPSTPFVENWHHGVICRLAEACVAGVPWAVRQVVNIPPGTSKSLLLCTFLPAWVWTEWPGFRSIYASYDIGVSLRDARRTLQILQSDWFKARWPEVRLRSKAPAEGYFENTAGGSRFATSVESKAIGRHAHLRVVDDPIKPLDTIGAKDASGEQLTKVIDWWSGTMSTRVIDHACPRYMVIMQRLHERDLAGHLLTTGPEEERPLRVSFPMRSVGQPFVSPDGLLRDPRTKEGELFWPARFPEPAVRSLENALGKHASAQLQQDPITPGGNLFTDAELRTYTEPPEIVASWASRLILSVDCSFKDTDGADNVAMQVWAEVHTRRSVPGLPAVGIWYALLDEIAERMSFVDTVRAVGRMLARWPDIGAKLVEDKANGPAVVSMMALQVPGMLAVNPQGGKIARANAVQHLYAAGNVWYPSAERATWISDHRAEMLKFPRGKHDDRVDAETQALLYLGGKGPSVWDVLEGLVNAGAGKKDDRENDAFL